MLLHIQHYTDDYEHFHGIFVSSLEVVDFYAALYVSIKLELPFFNKTTATLLWPIEDNVTE